MVPSVSRLRKMGGMAVTEAAPKPDRRGSIDDRTERERFLHGGQKRPCLDGKKQDGLR